MIFGKRSSRLARGQKEKSGAEKKPVLADEDTGPAVIRTPPMKPFARTAGPAGPAPRLASKSVATLPAVAKPGPAAATVASAAVPAPRPAEIIARHAPRGSLPDPRQIPGHTLVVGRDIRLTGEIRACQRLIVEGSVEAELTDTRTLEIAETGHFRGSAAVGECVVSGTFDGDLTVSGLLAVRAGGRVGGAIRYTEIEVERGGRITGRADLQGPQEVRATTRPA
ncbi:MAG TPA: polymer-forming cytoskeletal protein [Kiloniellales bacterium]